MAKFKQNELDLLKIKYNKLNAALTMVDKAKLLGIPRNTLKDLVNKDFLIKRSEMQLTSQEENTIIKYWTNGLDPAKIGRLINRNMSTVRNYLKQQNIYHDKRLVQNNPFCDSPESWYWIGYLATDGYLKKNSYNISLSQSGNNLGHLQFYAYFLEGNASVKINKNYGRDREVVAFSNKDSYEYLVNLGIKNKKSNSLKLSCLMNRDLLRGIFDGDGGIDNGFYAKFTSSSVNFLIQIEDYLRTNNIDFKRGKDKSDKKKPNHNPCFDIYINKKLVNMQKIYDLLYYPGCVCLKRKREKFEEYFRKQAEVKPREVGNVQADNPVPSLVEIH